MVKVSIVVPVYNVEKFISKCLESLVNQTLKEIEIIVVNDGSTDDSQAIIDDFVSQYPRILRSIKKENGGLSDARNFGLPYCKGEYIGFIDSDDYVELNMYERMYIQANKENSDIVACDYYKVYSTKNELVKAKKIVTKKDMFIDTLAVAWNKIYRRELLTKANAKFPIGLIYEDTEFYCKLIPYVEVFSYVPEPFVYYIQRHGSIANTQGEKNTQIFQILDNIISYYEEKNIFEEYRKELEYFTARILLGSSMERICRINNKQLRHQLLDKTVKYIYMKFPNWKKNYYLTGTQSKRHLYMKQINKVNIRLVGKMLNLVFTYKEHQLN